MRLRICPACSFFTGATPNITKDIINRPSITVGRMSGKLFVNDRCPHARGMTKAYETPEEITKEWDGIIEKTIATEDLTHKLEHVRIYEARNP